MPSETSVCNEALGELGSTLIQAFTDGTSVATLCGQFYPESRDATLLLHPWDFATRRTWLAPDPDAPAFGWTYSYVLPTNPYCLAVHETDRGQGTFWDIEVDSQGRRVLVSNENPVGIVYTARIEDLNQWSPLARQVLVKMLASRLAKPITGQNSLTELKLKEALTLLPEARRRDSQQGSPRILQLPRTLVAMRHRAGGVWPSTAPPGPWSP